jgi:hypothetical protein
MPRSLVHLLLSLLLLVSQQLSLSHGYTHWRDGGEPATAQVQRNPGGKPAKPALHDLCGQCAASASIAFALPPTVRRFVPIELAYGTPRAQAERGIRLLAAGPYQPRGPPRA